MIPVFDGHNDLLLRLHNAPEKRAEIWLTGEGKGHLDLPRMRQGGFAGGFFAIYIPSPHKDDGTDYQAAMESPPFHLPLPDLIGHQAAQATVRRAEALLRSSLDGAAQRDILQNLLSKVGSPDAR